MREAGTDIMSRPVESVQPNKNLNKIHVLHAHSEAIVGELSRVDKIKLQILQASQPRPRHDAFAANGTL